MACCKRTPALVIKKVKEAIYNSTKKRYFIDILKPNFALDEISLNMDPGRNNKNRLTGDAFGIYVPISYYSGNISQSVGHAIAAVKYQSNLYWFNSHGNDSIENEKVEQLYSVISNSLNLTPVIYRGRNLQGVSNRYGVCVGYAGNFIAEMLINISKNTLPLFKSQTEYDAFVEQLAITHRQSAFGNSSNCVMQQQLQMERNLLGQYPNKNSVIDTLLLLQRNKNRNQLGRYTTRQLIKMLASLRLVKHEPLRVLQNMVRTRTRDPINNLNRNELIDILLSSK